MAEETGFAFSMDSFRLDGKVALVTGGSYGIGFAIATALAQAGAKIAFNDRDQQKLEAGLASYAEAGVDARGYLADVTDEAQVAELVANIERDLGGVDILVNNAGIIKRIPMLEMSVEDFRQVVDVDLNAPFIVAKAVLPGMIERGHGKIINICSMMSELGRETVAGYAAAKGGLKMLTRNICSEFGEANTPDATALGRATSPTPADRSFTRASGRRLPSPVRPVHRLQDARCPLGHPRGPQGPRGLPGLRCFQLR